MLFFNHTPALHLNSICCLSNNSRYARPLCRDTNTLANVLRYLSQASRKTIETQCRQVCRTISRFFSFFLYECSLSGRGSPWPAAAAAAAEYDICVQVGSAQAEKQATGVWYRRISSGEFVLQQPFYPVMATVIKSEVKLFQTHCGPAASVWLCDVFWVLMSLFSCFFLSWTLGLKSIINGTWEMVWNGSCARV